MDRLESDVSRRQFLHGIAGATLAGIAMTGNAADAPKPSPWQIGCYTRPWAKLDYLKAFDAIAEAGFKNVGLMTAKLDRGLVFCVKTPMDEAHKIGEECKKRGLGVPSAFVGDIGVKESLEKGIADMHDLVDKAVAAGLKNLLMGGVGDPKIEPVYYKAIAESCDYAASKGVGISVKPHGGGNSNGPECRKLVESVNNKNFRLWYDPGNIYYYSFAKINPVDDAASVDGLVVGMCVKDYKAAAKDPDTTHGEVDITPGTGMVDFAKVMARLKQGGFNSGALVVECLSPGEEPQLLDEAKQTHAFLEKLVSGLA